MAEGFCNHYARQMGLSVRAASAGTRPEGYVHPHAIAVMKEVGIDISHQRSKGLRPEELLGYDYVISMGCSDRGICLAAFHGEVCDWGLEDPLGKPLAVYRRVRDEIERRVMELLREIEHTQPTER